MRENIESFTLEVVRITYLPQYGFSIYGYVTDEESGEPISSGTITHELQDRDEFYTYEDQFQEGTYYVHCNGVGSFDDLGVVFTFNADGYVFSG